jgi:hypothetical protein
MSASVASLKARTSSPALTASMNQFVKIARPVALDLHAS